MRTPRNKHRRLHIFLQVVHQSRSPEHDLFGVPATFLLLTAIERIKSGNRWNGSFQVAMITEKVGLGEFFQEMMDFCNEENFLAEQIVIKALF
jgi:hypothetical protein